MARPRKPMIMWMLCKGQWWPLITTSHQMIKWPTTPSALGGLTHGVGRMLQRLRASLHQSIPAACLLMSARPYCPSIRGFLIRGYCSDANGARPRTIMSACTRWYGHLLQKERHASLFAIEAAVAEAVLKFNTGNARSSTGILKELGLNPGNHSSKRMAEKDQRCSVTSSCKRSSADNLQRTLKKRHTGAVNQSDYMPGAY